MTKDMIKIDKIDFILNINISIAHKTQVKNPEMKTKNNPDKL